MLIIFIALCCEEYIKFELEWKFPVKHIRSSSQLKLLSRYLFNSGVKSKFPTQLSPQLYEAVALFFPRRVERSFVMGFA